MKTTSAQLMIQLKDKTEIERLLSIINLGVCAAIADGALSIEDAEAYLYSPYTLEQLEKLGVAQELIDAVHLGTELEDVRDLIPEKLDDSIQEIQLKTIQCLNALRSTPPTGSSTRKWIQI